VQRVAVLTRVNWNMVIARVAVLVANCPKTIMLNTLLLSLAKLRKIWKQLRVN
jgi:hypothetical protein